MLSSLSEFKFFQAFRIPIEEADQVRFLVEQKMGFDHYEYLSDVKIVDISLDGLGMASTQQLSIGQELRFSIQFKKIVIDIEGKVVRAFTGGMVGGQVVYGVALEEEGQDMKRFLQKYIFSLGPERLRDCLASLSLTDHYSRLGEGIELFTLIIAIFQDLAKFADQAEFLPLLLQEVVRILQAERASILLIHPESNELRAVATLGVAKEELQFNYRQGIAGSVFTTGISLNIDIVHDQVRSSLKGKGGLGPEVKSVICYPIHNSHDKAIGVIEVVNKRNKERFSIDDEEAMHILSLIFGVIFRMYHPFSANSQVRGFSTPFDREYAIIGKSTIIKKLRKSIGKLQDITTPVLIQGERGAGKTLLAQVVHFEGKRGIHELEIIDCLHLSEQEVEEKLFGQQGILLKMQGGTVVIKNGHQLSLPLQNELVDLLVKGSFPDSDTPFNFRLFITSCEDLEQKVAERAFNPKLFDYFSKAFIEIPPLRERKEDIEGLVNYFLKMECRHQGLLLKAFDSVLMETFREYEWPGNIGELRNYVVRAVIANPESHIISQLDDLAMPKIKRGLSGLKLFNDIPFVAQLDLSLKDRTLLIERRIIEIEIKRLKGNKSKAAQVMGISREALRKKLLHSQKVLDRLNEAAAAHSKKAA